MYLKTLFVFDTYTWCKYIHAYILTHDESTYTYIHTWEVHHQGRSTPTPWFRHTCYKCMERSIPQPFQPVHSNHGISAWLLAHTQKKNISNLANEEMWHVRSTCMYTMLSGHAYLTGKLACMGHNVRGPYEKWKWHAQQSWTNPQREQVLLVPGTMQGLSSWWWSRTPEPPPGTRVSVREIPCWQTRSPSSSWNHRYHSFLYVASKNLMRKTVNGVWNAVLQYCLVLIQIKGTRGLPLRLLPFDEYGGSLVSNKPAKIWAVFDYFDHQLTKKNKDGSPLLRACAPGLVLKYKLDLVELL